MSVFDAVASAIGEGVAYVAGRIIGRKTGMTPSKGQRIGGYLVIGIVAAFFLCLALLGIGA